LALVASKCVAVWQPANINPAARSPNLANSDINVIHSSWYERFAGQPGLAISGSDPKADAGTLHPETRPICILVRRVFFTRTGRHFARKRYTKRRLSQRSP
jgi:hypothetical protein